MKTKLYQPTEGPTEGGSKAPTEGGTKGKIEITSNDTSMTTEDPWQGGRQDPWQQEKEQEQEEEEVKEEIDIDSYLDSLITNKEKFIMQTRKPKIKEPIVPKIKIYDDLIVEQKKKEQDTFDVIGDFVKTLLPENEL